MSTVVVSETHSLPPDAVRGRLGDFEDTMRRWGVKLVWKKADRADIKGIGVSGDVVLHPGRVDVTVKLGLMAKAAGVDPERLRGSIERRIRAAVSDDPEQ